MIRRPLPAACALLCACAAHPVVPDDAALDVVEGRIHEVFASDDGGVCLTVPPSQRAFCVHADYSPDAASLEARARSLHAAGEVVRLTVWTRDPALGKANPGGSGVPGPPFVVVDLRAAGR